MSDLLVSFWMNVAAVVVGGLITMATSWWFYVRAARAFTVETVKLGASNNAMMGALLNPNAKRTPVYDADGNLVSVIVEATVSMVGVGSVRGAGGSSEP